MKTKEEFNAGKIAAITEQMEHIKRCVYMIKRISKYPKPKNVKTYLRRFQRTWGYAMSIKGAVANIHTIMAQTQSENLPNLFDNAK